MGEVDRSGRILHYLIEFGTERGEKLFEDEIFSVIAKIPTYERDEGKMAMYNTPPLAFFGPLAIAITQRDIDDGKVCPRDVASVRVENFLKMMRGQIEVKIEATVKFLKTRYGSFIESAQIDGYQLYEAEYMHYSSVPNRDASAENQELRRNSAEPKSPLMKKIVLGIELI